MNREGLVEFYGPSFFKMMGNLKGLHFDKLFEIERPKETQFDFTILSKTVGRTFLLKAKSPKAPLFRGQFEHFEDSDMLVFFGTPWFSSIEEVASNDLSISDFAPMDPLVDLLHLVKNQELVTSDLKELIGTMQEQKERLEELSYVASANSDGILFMDEKGVIIYVNDGYLKQTGYEANEIIGKFPLDIGRGEETQKKELESMLNSFFNKEQFKIELKHYRKDGSWFWARINGQAIHDKSGGFIHYFTQVEDVTEEKKTQNKIQEFEQVYRKVLEFSGDNVWELEFVDGKTNFSYKAENFRGLKFNELENSGKKWFSQLHQDDQYLLIENDLNYKSGKISSHQLEYRVLSEEGEEKWVKDRGIVVKWDSNGLPVRIIGTHSDITEQKNSEKELVDLNKKLGSVLNELRDVIWSVTYPELEGIFFTPSVKELFEIDMESMMKDKSLWRDIIHPDDVQVIAEIFGEIEIKNDFIKEYRIITPSGKVKWVQNKGKFIFEDGIPVRINGILVDITEQKNTEALLESKEKLKNILIEISSTYINIDLQEVDEKINNSLKKIGDFVNADRAYIFSYNLKEFTCSCTHEWCADGISREIENTQNVPLEYVPQWLESHIEGNPFIVEDTSSLLEMGMDGLYEILEPQGIKSLIAIPMMSNDGLLGFVGFDSVKLQHTYSQKEIDLLLVFAQMLVNVQRRKQTKARIVKQEEKFRNIITNMNLGLLEVDLNENILHANQTFCLMAGRSMEDLIGRKATDLLLDEDSKKVLHNKSNSRKSGVSDSYELRYRLPNGEYKWWLISGAPNYNDKNELIGSIGIHLDITAQKGLEEELIRQREDAEKSKRAKEIFFANMSHEIRTPMNAIVGMGEQLAKTTLNSQQEKYISAIQNSASHLMVIIKDILDLSKLEAGKLNIDSIGFKPHELLDHIVGMMVARAESKGLDFCLEAKDSGINEVLIGDPIRISQILLNLLSNAIKFTEIGKVTIQSELIEDAETYQKIAIRVKDTGIGMDEAFVSRGFEKYVQEDSTITRKYGGTGLGLSITKELVDLMGGDMLIESQKNVGTTISILLTLPKGYLKDLPMDVNKYIDLNLIKGKKILVVDDNEFNRLVASTILEQHEVVIGTANNGKEAVEELRNSRYDLVLMDMQMPVMDGVLATKIIREELNSNVPIIALTAFAMKDDQEKYMAKGMNAFLAKPFQEDDLLHEISKLLGGNERAEKTQEREVDEIKILPKSRYSLKSLENIANGNSDFIHNMMKLFQDTTPSTMREAKVAFDKGEYDEVRKLVHRIKPSVKMLNIHEISDEISELENEVVNQMNSDRMTYLISHIIEVLDWVAQDVKSKGI
tara:strand:+ start:21933 stop:25943 length:4011 start_codon:yes stop_codon:yes gene_type:complete